MKAVTGRDPITRGEELLIQDPVGHGSTSVVCRATVNDGSHVAIKFASDPRFHARVRREASVLAFLEHPHILRFHQLVEFDYGPGLVIGLCEGGSLASSLAEGRRVSLADVARIGSRLGDALAYLHAQGVVHHDISPANVLLSGDGSPILGDFGSATAPWASPPSAVEGTRRFTAPEIRAGEAGTTSSDVFSLAAVCLAALPDEAGQREEAAESAAAHLRRALVSATDPDPEARPAASELCRVLADLAFAGPDGTVEYGPRPRPTPPSEPPEKAGALVPLVGVVTLATVVLVVALYILVGG